WCGFPDHHAPPLGLLFTVGASIRHLLCSAERAVQQQYGRCTHGCRLTRTTWWLSIASRAKGAPGWCVGWRLAVTGAELRHVTLQVIACYLLYCGLFQSAEEALNFFAVKRSMTNWGVTGPSQRRCVVAALARRSLTPRVRYAQYFSDIV